MHAVNSSVRIVVSLDESHTNSEEMKVTQALSEIDPNEKIICFLESRNIEAKEIGQYSLELLAEDKKISTSTSIQLLMDSILVNRAISYLGDIVAGIYTDPYFRILFDKDHFANYSPQKKSFCEEGSDRAFSLKNLNPGQMRVITTIKLLFKILDQELPRQPVHLREKFFEGQIKACLQTITALDYHVMSYIAEALAVIKIEQVQKIAPQGEVSLEDVKELLYGPEGLSGEKLLHLSTTMRTKFQLEKITAVILRILQEPQNVSPTFVVRVGQEHRNDLIAGLQSQFGESSVHIVDLRGKTPETMLKLIKA